MLGLAQHLPSTYRSVFLSFSEQGKSRSFLDAVRQDGFSAIELRHNAPHVSRAVNEVTSQLRELQADVLCCSGYKPDIMGVVAARRAKIPVVAVAHGWTAATWKVRFNEILDRFAMRWMDAVVCVSEAQEHRVRRAGISAGRTTVIRNAIDTESFQQVDGSYRSKLESFFVSPRSHYIGTAGRLSPEKGIDQLVEAASIVRASFPAVGFVVFGDGPLRQKLEQLVLQRKLQQNVVFAGFRTDVRCFLAHLDLAVLPSHTEGLPVFVLEAFAAGLPAVATAVGGTPEVVDDGNNGYLVKSNDFRTLAARIEELLGNPARRRSMGERGRQRAESEFSFQTQSRLYQRLFERLLGNRAVVANRLSNRNSAEERHLAAAT